VSCQLEFNDGVADIASFQTGARAANWLENEITITVIRAVYKSSRFDDVGEILCQYCTKDSLTGTAGAN
jgi:hypothetical protein